jgi:hypothetical protein
MTHRVLHRVMHRMMNDMVTMMDDMPPVLHGMMDLLRHRKAGQRQK